MGACHGIFGNVEHIVCDANNPKICVVDNVGEKCTTRPSAILLATSPICCIVTTRSNPLRTQGRCQQLAALACEQLRAAHQSAAAAAPLIDVALVLLRLACTHQADTDTPDQGEHTSTTCDMFMHHVLHGRCIYTVNAPRRLDAVRGFPMAMHHANTRNVDAAAPTAHPLRLTPSSQ